MALVDKFEYSTGSFVPEQAAHEFGKADLKVIEDFHKLYFKLLEKKSGLQLSWLGTKLGRFQGIFGCIRNY